ncbi:MAG: hypothetical protein WHT09_13615 [Thermogutta sp.]
MTTNEPPFDPYRKWLGIPPEEQPPNYYRLLGIPLFEGDPDVIINAADRQIGHVRRFQAGKYADACQRILNELAAARVCLLDPVRKREYDQRLFFELQRRGVPLPLPVAQPLPQEPSFAGLGAENPSTSFSSPEMPASQPAVGIAAERVPVTVLLRRRRRDIWKDPAVALGLGVLFLLVCVLAILVIFRKELLGM